MEDRRCRQVSRDPCLGDVVGTQELDEFVGELNQWRTFNIRSSELQDIKRMVEELDRVRLGPGRG